MVDRWRAAVVQQHGRRRVPSLLLPSLLIGAWACRCGAFVTSSSACGTGRASVAPAAAARLTRGWQRGRGVCVMSLEQHGGEGGDEQQDSQEANERWRHSIEQLQREEAVKVVRVNSDFYNALTEKDIDVMGRVWQKDDLVQCLHPGSPPVQGYESVMKVFRKMFASRDNKQRRFCIAPEQVRVHVRGASAWVTCVEEVLVAGHGATPRHRLCATNIFRKAGKRWYMIHHHASPYPTNTGAPMGGGGGGSGDQVTLGDLLAGGMGNGTGGPRIITVSGADAPEQVQEIIDSLQKGQQPQGDMKTMGGNGPGQFFGGKEGGQGQGEGGMGEVPGTRTFRLAGAGGGEGGDSNSMEARIMAAVQDEGGEGDDDDRDLTRRTVAAIREMCATDRISDKEKRVLLTDVIKHATGESPSMVEVAYELLLSQMEGAVGAGASFGDDDACEEFAEQCRIFAADIMGTHAPEEQ